MSNLVMKNLSNLALYCCLVLAFSAQAEIDKTDPFKLVQVVAHDLFERIAKEQAANLKTQKSY